MTLSRRAPAGPQAIRPLVLARGFVFFGNAFGTVGLAFGVLDLPGGSAGELGVILFARSVAQVALLLWGGVLGDRYNKIAIMRYADGVAGLSQLMLGVVVLAEHNQPWLLAALAAVNGGASAIFMPASVGVMPELVPPAGLQAANAAVRMSANLATLLGSALAGVVVAVLGAGTALTINAAMFGASVMALRRLNVQPRADAAPATSTLGDLRSGWQAFTALRWVWVIVLQASIINALFRGAVQVLGPVVTEPLPHGAQLWGLALGAQALGLLAGSGLAYRLQVRAALRLAVCCLAVMGFPLVFLGTRIPVLWVFVPMFAAGFAVDLFMVLWDTSLQQRVPGEALARVSSYDALGSFGLAPLGILLAGLLAEQATVRPVLIAAGLLIIAVALAGLAVPEIRNFDSRDAIAVPVER